MMNTDYKYLERGGLEYVVKANDSAMCFAIMKRTSHEEWRDLKESLAGRFVAFDDYRIGLNVTTAIEPYNPYCIKDASNWSVLDEAAKALDWLYGYLNLPDNKAFDPYKNE